MFNVYIFSNKSILNYKVTVDTTSNTKYVLQCV